MPEGNVSVPSSIFHVLRPTVPLSPCAWEKSDFHRALRTSLQNWLVGFACNVLITGFRAYSLDYSYTQKSFLCELEFNQRAQQTSPPPIQGLLVGDKLVGPGFGTLIRVGKGEGLSGHSGGCWQRLSRPQMSLCCCLSHDTPWAGGQPVPSPRCEAGCLRSTTRCQ